MKQPLDTNYLKQKFLSANNAAELKHFDTITRGIQEDLSVDDLLEVSIAFSERMTTLDPDRGSMATTLLQNIDNKLEKIHEHH